MPPRIRSTTRARVCAVESYKAMLFRFKRMEIKVRITRKAVSQWRMSTTAKKGLSMVMRLSHKSRMFLARTRTATWKMLANF